MMPRIVQWTQLTLMPLSRLVSLAIAFQLCVAVALSVTVHAESERSITGVVFDSTTGAPIQDAVIRIVGTGFSSRSGSDGGFEILSVPAGSWRVQVDRYGYHPITPLSIEVVEGFERTIRLGLMPDPIVLAPSVVLATPGAGMPSSAVRHYSQEQIRQAGHRTVAEALAAIPGVRVYGSSESPGGTRVSVGGASPDRVALLFDGLPLANGSDGTVNLDVIPLAAVKSIDVSLGAQSAGSGDAAIGGTVNLRTRRGTPVAQQDVSLSGGSFGTYRGTLNSGLRLWNHSAEVVLEASGRGNRFTYPDGDSDGVRAGVRVQAWRGFLGVAPAGNASVHASGFVYRSTVGAPGALEQLSPGATNQNERQRAQASWDWLHRTKLSVGSALWFELGDDRLRSTKPFKNDTESLERFLGARLTGILALPGATGHAELEFRSRHLEGKDRVRPSQAFGSHDRREFSLRTALKRTVTIGRSLLSVSLTGAVDGDDRYVPVHSPRIDAGCWNLHGFHARLGWGRSFRRPTLTSLFWKADAFAVGNPDLRPERASEWDAEAGYRHQALSLESRYFERQILDIISWERDAMGKFKPKNISRAFIVGREDHASLALFGDRIALAYTHVFNGAYDRSGEINHDGMVLVMSPRHTHDFSASMAAGRLSARLTGRWASSRELRRDNHSGKRLPPYRLFDGYARLAAHRSNPSVKVGIRVDNMTNERVDLLERYPSQGRAWFVETVFEL